MNFLAHFTLSGTQNPKLTIGNFLGDFVKGKKYKTYPPEIRQGILLHRAIDTYTDHHPIVLQSKRRLYSQYHHYGAVLVDLYYDHFLAVHFSDYSSQKLTTFTQQIYAILYQYKDQLPERAGLMLPYMRRDNWLLHYGTLEGIDQACQGIARRSPYASHMARGVEGLKSHYPFFEEEFKLFFEEIREYVKNWLRGYQEL